LEIEHGIFILQVRITFFVIKILNGQINLLSPSIAAVAEVEMLWCTSRQRSDRNNGPSYIYYVVDFKAVKSHVESMRAETDRLIEELKRGDNYRL
jgi:hypothetical protein